MKRSEWLIVGLFAAILVVWGTIRFAQTQYFLEAPVDLPKAASLHLPDLPSAIAPLVAPKRVELALIAENRVWGIVPPIDPTKPAADGVVFTPSSSGRPARICIGISCYEFIGFAGKKALFYDTNVSATKKTLALGSGSTLRKPIRIQKITPGSITLIDTKTKTTYELSQFKIDLAPYQPKSDPTKGK